MEFIPTPIPGLVLYEPRVFQDDRGHFFESFNEALFSSQGIVVRSFRTINPSARKESSGLTFNVRPTPRVNWYESSTEQYSMLSSTLEGFLNFWPSLFYRVK